MSRHAGWHPAAGSADSRSATGPGECEFEGAGHLEQEVLPPWSGDDLDADGQTGGLVMVDGEEAAGWPVTLNTDVNTPIG